MENGTVLTVTQAFEFNAAVSQQLPRDISREDVRYWDGHKGELGKALRSVLVRQRPVQLQVSSTFATGKPLTDLGRPKFWLEMW
ncbi:MAG: hypothetical protein NTZ18_00105 [Candidatus Komeilibacteria bacterium]|nr:hypothetical protein [Candidatus Komeilibacteria bacterium]